MKFIKILLELYKEEYDLNLREGEIKTIELGKTISILQKKYNGILGVRGNKVNNDFIVKITKKIDTSKFDDFIRDANNLGWFPSFIKCNSFSGKYSKKSAHYYIEDGDPIELNFEAKYDIVVEKHPEILYHIAPTKNSDKIEKIGLVPKSRSKTSYHPERVYLASSKDAALVLVNQFVHRTGIRDWTLFSIDTSKIPGDYLKLYKDPNYKEKGFYTLNNIPPVVIKRVEDIKANQ